MSDSATVDQLESRYRVRFAGHPRVTRDIEELEQMVAELGAVAARASGALAERIAGLDAGWRKEIEAIRLAQAMPYALPAARLRTWSELTISRYARSFAGRDRRTRDLGLLIEIRTDLAGVREAMAELAGSAPGQGLERNLEAVDQQLRIHQTEIEAIRAARKTGTLAEQGSRLAELANDQFALYDRHFARQPRISRHPATLERILASLDEIRRGMQALYLAGLEDDANRNNQGIVDQRIRAFGTELDAIRKARNEATVAQRATALGTAANEIFARYRDHFAGKDRKDSDPELLNDLFELLWPIAREMDELDVEHDVETNSRNLRLVVDTLVLYAREFDAIRKARG